MPHCDAGGAVEVRLRRRRILNLTRRCVTNAALVLGAAAGPLTAQSTRAARADAAVPDSVRVRELSAKAWELRRVDPLTAISLGKEALALAERARMPEGAAQQLNRIGVFYQWLNDERTASRYFFRALAFADSNGIAAEHGYALNNIAGSLLRVGEAGSALDYARNALALHSESSNLDGVAYALVRLAEVHNVLQQFDSAESHSRRAVQVWRERRLESNALSAVRTLGAALEGQGKLAAARSAFRDITQSDSVSRVTRLNVLNDLARLALKMNRPDEAIALAEEKLQADTADGEMLQLLGRAYAAKGDFGRAYAMMSRGTALSDSAARRARFQELANLQLAHETARLDDENAALRREVRLNRYLAAMIAAVALLAAAAAMLLVARARATARVADALRQAKDAAETATIAKSRFLATMSHEIRTPMSGVLGMAELLASSPLSAEQARFVNAIRSSGASLLNIINDILDLSKIEAGRMEVDPVVTDVRALGDEIGVLLGVRASEKGLEWAVHVDASVPATLVVDRLRVRQVILNLAGNAVKFTEQGRVGVTIRAEMNTDGSGTLIAQVCDTGIGIDPDEISRLFEPFTQGDASTTRKFGGTGLGLNISRQLVELMGGEISATSERGGGSTFTIRLPVRAVAAGSAARRISGGHRSDALGQQDAAAPAALSALKVLVADDNPTNRLLMEFMLRKLGATKVESVADGSAAVDAAVAGDFDVILMDVNMPGVDGLVATARIIEQLGTRRPAIIALTADAMPGDRERCLAAGMDDYLTKPVDLADIRRSLERWAAVPG